VTQFAYSAEGSAGREDHSNEYRYSGYMMSQKEPPRIWTKHCHWSGLMVASVSPRWYLAVLSVWRIPNKPNWNHSGTTTPVLAKTNSKFFLRHPVVYTSAPYRCCIRTHLVQVWRCIRVPDLHVISSYSENAFGRGKHVIQGSECSFRQKGKRLSATCTLLMTYWQCAGSCTSLRCNLRSWMMTPCWHTSRCMTSM
jgi:hypothetical protein